MKKISNLLMMALLTVGMGLTSCDEQLDNAVVPGVTPGTDEGEVTSITVDLSKIDEKYLDTEKTKLQLTVGDEVTLSFTILPEEMASTEVELTAADATILSIDGLKVKALKEGETTVTAKAGDKTAECTVTVSQAAVDLSNITEDYTAQDGAVLTGTLGSDVKISIADGATVTLNNVSINADDVWKDGSSAGITCLGDATINLEGTNNKVKGFGASYPGIYVPVNKTLIIQGSGSLDASSGMDSHASEFGAGIGGGGESGSCGDITIKGGNITATGGISGGAGIGSGYNQGTCGNITITGGTITAEGGDRAAGIGGGAYASCGNIEISGGTVEATGGDYAAGIGGGYKNGTCGTITITSGVTKVTATKGADAPYSIGKGSGSSAKDITVTIGGAEGAITISPYEYPPIAATAHELSASVVGDVVGSNGKAYTLDATHVLPSGVTAVAMVAYKSTTAGKSLAIQLNSSPVKKNWEDAMTYAEGLTAVTGGTWGLPSKEDWQNMFVGCAVSGDASASNYMNPIAGFKAKIAATGITWQSFSYWSSTKSGSNTLVVGVYLNDSNAYAGFDEKSPSLEFNVLGCLAF